MHVRRFPASLVRGFWRVEVFDGFGAGFFWDEFYRGTEEIVQEPPFFGIEVIKG